MERDREGERIQRDGKRGAKWDKAREERKGNTGQASAFEERMIQSRGGKGGRGGVVGSRRERNTALTQTMRSLERSFQGLRKAYNPVYRPRKSGDIYSAAGARLPTSPRSSSSPPRAKPPFSSPSTFRV